MLYQRETNELEFETKYVPQNSGEIIEEIIVDNYDSKCQYFFELQCPKRKKFISEEIVFNDNKGTIILPKRVNENVGEVYVQLVIRNNLGEVEQKSFISKIPLLVVEKSINASGEITKEQAIDYVSYIQREVNLLKNIKNEVETKLNNGEFNGKDGTIIKVNNNIKKVVSFVDEPQEQINRKANISNVNMLSILPSVRQVNNIYTNPKEWNEPYCDYTTPDNGYILVSFKTINNEQIENKIACTKDNIIVSQNSTGPFSFEKNYNLFLPVIAGAKCRLIIVDWQKVVENSFVSTFIYSGKI